MDASRFTGSARTMRNLRVTIWITVPCVLLLLFLILARGLTEAWIGLVIVAAFWALIAYRFSGTGTRGLPPQR